MVVELRKERIGMDIVIFVSMSVFLSRVIELPQYSHSYVDKIQWKLVER